MRETMPVFHASLLVAGTAIGAGMIALPVVTADAGVVGATALYGICWLFSLITGLLFVQIQRWMGRQVNLMTMSKELLGVPGYIVTGCFYIFLFYSLTMAYITGTSSILQHALPPFFPRWLPTVLVSLFMGNVVFLGMRGASRINLYLMAGLIVSYIGFLWVGFQQFDPDFLFQGHIQDAWIALPVIYTAFSYQGVIPTLYTYLHGDIKQVRLSIIIGTTLPLIAYIVWDILIKGIIPLNGPESLTQAKLLGQSIIEPLSYFLPGSAVVILGTWFAFCALATSFLGVTMGLTDFLFDAFDAVRNHWNRLKIVLLVFIPPTIVALINPNIFLFALGLAGGVGCAVLLGLMPILMVIRGKYSLKLPCSSRGIFHGVSLFFLLFCSIAILFSEVWGVIAGYLIA